MLMQNRMPLLEALMKYAASDVAAFHTPGHKLGKGMQRDFAEFVGRNVLAIDLTLVHGIDDLHEPKGPIKEAQDLAADLFGAEESFFLINGTTGGMYAMIMSICGPGDKIIVPRNAHRSIIGGIILCGGNPIFVSPEIDQELGIAMGVTYESIKTTLDAHPDAKGVLLINPTYYGVVTDIKAIIDLVHSYDLPVLVDEAHGPHLHFSNMLPLSAIAAGADMCAQSTHKILGAMTQCSMLHVQKGRIDVARLKTALRLVQSTSPNYVLMASLDAARMQMAMQGPTLIESTIKLAQEIRKRINDIPGLYCFGAEKSGQPGIYDVDPTKVTVTVKGIGLSGSEVEYLLRYEYNIQAELSDLYNVLFLITLGDSKREGDLLVDAFRDLVATYAKPQKINSHPPGPRIPDQPIQRVSPRDAFFSKMQSVPFRKAAGLLCGEIVTFYPPGIPILCPGEEITDEIIQYCDALLKGGLQVSGPEDVTLTTIRILNR